MNSNGGFSLDRRRRAGSVGRAVAAGQRPDPAARMLSVHGPTWEMARHSALRDTFSLSYKVPRLSGGEGGI